MMGWTALMALLQQFYPDLAELAAEWGVWGHGHGHSHSDLGPNINAAWLAGGSILIKEWLYRASMAPCASLVLMDYTEILCHSSQSCQRTQIVRARI